MILVDTDILVDLLRGESGTAQLLNTIASDEPLAVSIVSKMELIVGCRNRDDLANVADLLGRFDVIPINEPSSQRAAALLQEFRLSHGMLIPDALIAATALMRDCALLTNNRKHFSFTPGLKLVAPTQTG